MARLHLKHRVRNVAKIAIDTARRAFPLGALKKDVREANLEVEDVQ